ncbi:hypothetical protein VCNHCC008D_003381B, partial [Vibrio cholerae O1 str. NHCC-008D]
LIWVARAQSR